MPGLFQTSILSARENLDEGQRARGAALLVAREARPEGSVTELLQLARFVVSGRHEPAPTLPQIFGNTAMSNATITIPTMDPVHPTPANPSAPIIGEGWRPARVEYTTFDEEEQPDDGSDEPR